MRLLRQCALTLVVAAGAVLSACSGGGGNDASRSTTQAAPVLPPLEFAVQPKAFTATLTWSPDPSSGQIDHYEIFRKKRKLADVPATETSYVDDDVAPGGTYVYEIQARRAGEASERARVRAKMTVPPLGTARFAGHFSMSSNVQSSSGFETLSDSSTFGWRVRATCRNGPCSATWQDLQLGSVRGELKRKGAHYTGSYTGFFGSRCSGARSIETAIFDLEVVRARAINDQWRATRLTGTMEVTSNAQLGCVSTRRTESLVAQFSG